MKRGWAGRLGALLFAAPIVAGLGAQQPLGGVVRDSAGGQPVSGAVVSILDAAGRVEARTIASEQGRFSVPFSASGARIRIVRIGYQPREIAIAGAALANGSINISMVRIPALLESVRVNDKSVCPGSAERSDALVLWEQARAGLLATVVARQAKPANVSMMVYERALLPDDDRVLGMTTKTRSGSSTRPFAPSVAAEVFTRIGYMQDSGSSRMYHAPDADVLLDESFAATHCFQVARDATGHPGEIGLAFEPAEGRDSLVDVRGTLWMDGTAPALRTLEFRYTGIEPAAVDVKSGGTLTFRGMPNGVVLIEQWSLRLAVMTEIRSLNKLPGQLGPDDWRGRRTRRDLRVSQIKEHGGVVLTASWPGGTRWTTTLGALTGSVVRRLTGAPVANAVVTLEGTNESARADAEGHFAIIPLLPGRYSIRAVDTSLADFIPPRWAKRDVTVFGSGGVLVNLDLPTVDEVARRMCRGTEVPDGTSILLGKVVTWDGSAARDFELRATWQTAYSIDVGRSAVISGRERRVDPDDQGHFYLCGVVRERPIRLHITRGTAVLADTAVRVMGDTLVRTVTVRVP